ncbi:hypothetical protein TWF694_011748 [Orbilia ellipsospora]|uniref:Peptidase S8/S53 domain-containing protein n=1 Tax=Orbilia ellipsospora TaxID=2528407 RepID=A0AAV9X7D6_9PEZI
MEQAIKEASDKGILIFAAASNTGNIPRARVAFPASLYGRVMAMFACGVTAKVMPNTFNPVPTDDSSLNFAFLGEDVKAFPNKKLQSGTSYATFIGAGVAAALFDFYKQDDVLSEMKSVEKLNSITGISAVFKYMSVKEGRYRSVLPWHWLSGARSSPEDERKRIIHILFTALAFAE